MPESSPSNADVTAQLSNSRLNPDAKELTLFSSILTSHETKLQQIRCNVEETETRDEARITALESKITETEARNEAQITTLEW